MAKQSQYTVYRYAGLNGEWRYCRAAYHPKNHKIIPNAVIVGGQQEVHEEGEYYLRHEGKWIPAGQDATKAQQKRAEMLAMADLQRLQAKSDAPIIPIAQPIAPTTKHALAAASEKYFANLEARGVGFKHSPSPSC